MLAGVGIALIVVGSLDLGGLPWLPPLKLGIPVWTYGSGPRAYSGLFPATLGLALLLAAAVAVGRRIWVLVFSSVFLSVGTLLVLAPLLYLTGVGMAWVQGENPRHALGLEDIFSLQFIRAATYPLLHLWLGLKGLHWGLTHK